MRERAHFDFGGMGWPRTLTGPSSTELCAVRRRMVVDLPAPLGPSSPSTTPWGTSRSRPLTAVMSPKRFTTPRSEIAGGESADGSGEGSGLAGCDDEVMGFTVIGGRMWS